MMKLLLAVLLLFSVNAYATHRVSAYHVDVSDKLPSAAKCDSGDSDVLKITTDGAFTTANLNNATYTYFCVAAGVDGGDVSITASGTAETPKVIFLDDDLTTHPVLLDSANRATLDSIGFDGGDYWILDRITVHGTGESSVDNGAAAGVSTNIHLQRMLVEGSGGGAGQVNIGNVGFVLQDSVVRNSLQSTNDDHCVNIANGDDILVLDNELYDCTGDMLQHHGQDTKGTVIDGNELYVSSAMRTDCAGTINGTGACLAVENALDFKTGGDGTFAFDDTADPSEVVIISNNIMWGFDRVDDTAFVSGGGGDDTVIIHQGAKGIIFENNFFDGMGADPSFAIVYANITPENITFKNNLFYRFDVAISSSLNGGEHEYYQNTFLDVTNIFNGGEDTSDYMCNVLINVTDSGAASLGTGSAAHDNAFYNVTDKAPLYNSGDIDEASAATAANGTFTYTKTHITNPTVTTVSNAVTGASSPHFATCDNPTETATRGINDTDQLTTTKAGFFLGGITPHFFYRMMR